MKYLTIILLSSLMSGCLLGPDYQRQKDLVDVKQRFLNESSQQEFSIEDPNNPWWLHFGDPLTAELVKEALANNHNLQAAAARVLQADALLTQAQGARKPALDYGYNASRSQNSFISPVGRQTFRSSTNAPSISASYMTDLFGKLKRSEEQAQQNLLASIYNQKALQQLIIASVVKARITISTLEKQLEIAKGNTRSWQAAYEIVNRRYNRGLLEPLDLRVAKENLARSKSVEPSIELSLIKSRNALDLLLARKPGSSDPLPNTLSDLPDLQPVPLIVPANLLDRRPDLLEAERQLHAATANVGLKMAQLYPDLNLFASTGYNSNNTSELFVSGSYVYNIAMQLAGPLYQGGRLKAQVKQAEARVQELSANYANKILVAIREVEDALAEERLIQQRLIALEERFVQAKAAEKLAYDRYLKGVVQLATVLETERSRRTAQDELNSLKGQIWQARVNLLLALGGDWHDYPHKDNNDSISTKINDQMENDA